MNNKKSIPYTTKNKHITPMEQANAMNQFTAAKTDPMGSYTGRPVDPYDTPVQDADDL